MVYGDFVSCMETNRTLGSKLKDWQIFIETKEEWKRKLNNLQICKEGTGRMKRSVKGRKAKEKNRE